MFVIYRRQIGILDSYYLNKLIVDIKEHVQEFFPEEYKRITQDPHDKVIREAITVAKSYNLRTDRNLTVFVDFVLAFGSQFPQYDSWAEDILLDDTLSEDQKIEQLVAHEE